MSSFSPAKYTAYCFATMVGVLFAVWVYVVRAPLAFMPSGYPSWLAKEAMLNTCQAATIDFFGDSRVEAGIIATALPVSANNLGVAAGTPIEVESGVRRALGCGTKPKLIVIALNESAFGPLTNFFWLESLSYTYLSFRDLRDIELHAGELGDIDTLQNAKTPEGLSGPVRDWLYALRFPSLSFSNLVQGRVFGRYRDNFSRLGRIQEARGFVPYTPLPTDDRPGPEARLTGFSATKLQISYFERALAEAQENGVEVELLMMPIKKATKDRMAAGVEAGYFDYLRSLPSRFHNVSLVTENMPAWPSVMFTDEVHLTPAGAEQFTSRLSGCIEGASIRTNCNLNWDEPRQ